MDTATPWLREPLTPTASQEEIDVQEMSCRNAFAGTTSGALTPAELINTSTPCPVLFRPTAMQTPFDGQDTFPRTADPATTPTDPRPLLPIPTYNTLPGAVLPDRLARTDRRTRHAYQGHGARHDLDGAGAGDRHDHALGTVGADRLAGAIRGAGDAGRGSPVPGTTPTEPGPLWPMPTITPWPHLLLPTPSRAPAPGQATPCKVAVPDTTTPDSAPPAIACGAESVVSPTSASAAANPIGNNREFEERMAWIPPSIDDARSHVIAKCPAVARYEIAKY